MSTFRPHPSVAPGITLAAALIAVTGPKVCVLGLWSVYSYASWRGQVIHQDLVIGINAALQANKKNCEGSY